MTETDNDQEVSRNKTLVEPINKRIRGHESRPTRQQQARKGNSSSRQVEDSNNNNYNSSSSNSDDSPPFSDFQHEEPIEQDPCTTQLQQRHANRSKRNVNESKDGRQGLTIPKPSSRRNNGSPNVTATSGNKGHSPKRKHHQHKSHNKNKERRHRSKPRRHRNTQAMTHENIESVQSHETSSNDTGHDIARDIRNYGAWEDEEVASQQRKKNKKAKRGDSDNGAPALCPTRRICIITILLVLIIGGGLAYLFLAHPPTEADDVEVSETATTTLAPAIVETEKSPSIVPDVSPSPSSSPTPSLLFDPPSEKDCLAIQKGEMIVGQEELPVETLYLDMDITLRSADSNLDMTNVTSLLVKGINQVLVPEVTGCNDDIVTDKSVTRKLHRNLVDVMKYLIANASVEAFQSANGACTSQEELPCFKVAVLFDLAVRAQDVKVLTLYRRISSSFGEDGQSLVAKLGLGDIFQDIHLEILYLEDFSVAPSGEPSTIAPSLPPSIAPSQLPTSQPSKNPTQNPSSFASRYPTNPPSPRPTPDPTPPPTNPPTPNPTPPPTDTPPVQISTLTSPQQIVSSDGILSTSLSLEETTFTIPNSNIRINGRLLGGQFPGPTLRLRAGDTLQIAFSNNLQDQGLGYVHNRYSGIDDSNLHFHGLYVSGELPSDDVTHHISPGASYTYSTDLPSNHMGGTFWMHPHRHGATALQVGGGANCVIIVEDEAGVLPSEVENAREVIFIAQYFDVRELERVAQMAGDALFSISGYSDDEFVTVNGQLNPTIEVDAGEWFRLRVVWVNFLQGDLDLRINNCEMQLLAKDGVYIRDYPRRIFEAEVPSGGRADIMVRCPDPSTTYTISGIVSGFAFIRTSSTDVDSGSLQSWSPSYPDYLTDLRSTSASSGCSCSTSLRGTSVNGRSYPSSESYIHQSYIGAVVERDIEAVQHPYHQHVYPFQLVDGTSSSTYYAIGDWHDVVKGRFNVRYSPNRYSGKLMIHCHRLVHEDRGMMAVEQVLDTGSCSCNYT